MSLDMDVFEIILRDEHLMSNLFTASEIALSKLALEKLEGDELNIVVGGLGMGYTAAAMLEDKRVNSLVVVEFLDAVTLDAVSSKGTSSRCQIRFRVLTQMRQSENSMLF